MLEIVILNGKNKIILIHMKTGRMIVMKKTNGIMYSVNYDFFNKIGNNDFNKIINKEYV